MKRRDPTVPPKWPLRLLRFLVKREYLEEIEGDMEEIHRKNLQLYAPPRARRQYALEVLKLIRPEIMARPSLHFNHNITDMFENYFKIAWRNFYKNKMYSIIKVGGFAIGIAAALLIALFVTNELSYDRHYANTDRIYRLINVYNNPAEQGKWTAFSPAVAQVIRDRSPEVEKIGRLIPYDWYNAGSNQFRRADGMQNNYEEGFAYADQELIEILELPMVYGKRERALASPKSLLISKRIADKYYPGEDPVGKNVILNENTKTPYTIGGVMANFPPGSHLQFDFLLTLTDEEFWDGEQTNWCCSNYNPYLLLRADVDPRELETKLLYIRDDYVVQHNREEKNSWADSAEKYLSFELQPVADIHLKSKGIDDIFPNSDIRIVRLFGVIAIFILLLACINFINLSTAKSANRAKETGLRKVVGSYRSDLIQQFLTESIFFSAISVVLGTLLAWVLLPYFNELSGKVLVFPWTAWWLAPVLLGLTFMIGLLAGIYPSFYLSSFRPADVIKGNVSRGTKHAGLRSSMVVFQFATSMVLTVSAFIVYQQMQFILHKDLGYDKEQVLLIQGANTLGDQYPMFKEELLRLPEVKNVTVSNYLPVSGTKRDENEFWKDGRNQLDDGIGAQIWRTDEDYMATLGMHLLDGRTFSKDIASDSAAIIINETMAKKLGLENPVGQKIMNRRTWTIIGLVEDFHFESMKGGIGSLAFTYNPYGENVAARVDTENMKQALASITGIWDRFMPDQPMRYTFLDESFAHMYEDVQRTGNVFTACAVLAIIIACLGLFGLSTFMAEQRSKEISIRKVLGASMGTLYQLLTVNFLKLVLIALVISVPVAWYLMHKWLEDYEYKAGISWWIFVAAGLLIVGIALFTVSRQALKVAFSNPVDHLRGE